MLITLSRVIEKLTHTKSIFFFVSVEHFLILNLFLNTTFSIVLKSPLEHNHVFQWSLFWFSSDLILIFRSLSCSTACHVWKFSILVKTTFNHSLKCNTLFLYHLRFCCERWGWGGVTICDNHLSNGLCRNDWHLLCFCLM